MRIWIRIQSKIEEQMFLQTQYKIVHLLPSLKFLFRYIKIKKSLFVFRITEDLKVVTNEKGEAVGDVLTIIC